MNLDVYLHGELIARTASRSRGAKFVIEYAPEMIAANAAEATVLSCSLPLPGPSTPSAARAFLEGLLPEGGALESIAARIRGVRLAVDGISPAEPADTIRILAEYGLECAGAVALVPAGTELPAGGEYRPVSADNIGTLIHALPDRPLGAAADANLRMSLAGNQPKLLLARFGELWFQPVGSAASTHILKPESAWPFSADNEATVMRLARSVGLTDSASEVATFGGVRTLVAERFDRRVDTASQSVTRLHQEDMCQALGLRPREKYFIGPPSKNMARLLRSVMTADATGVRDLFLQEAFRAIAGDEDGHGKNYGLMIEGGVVRVSPLYDSLCTLLYPELSGTMAAPLGTARNLAGVALTDITAEGTACGLPETEARDLAADLAERIIEADVPPEGIDPHTFDGVIGVIKERARRLLRSERLGAPSADAQFGKRRAPHRGHAGATIDAATRRLSASRPRHDDDPAAVRQHVEFGD
jgi:serine/threonine-protein kinase HipA